jgi:hypothetical protein
VDASNGFNIVMSTRASSGSSSGDFDGPDDSSVRYASLPRCAIPDVTACMLMFFPASVMPPIILVAYWYT